MHKEYKHPAPYRPDHDYLGGIHAADKHMRDITKREPHPGQAQHLGGMASYKHQLEEFNNGEAHKVRQEIKHVLDYLFYYSQNDHDIYYFFAEELASHAEKLMNEIKDPQEKEHAQYFIDSTKEYMLWLKNEMNERRSMRNQEQNSFQKKNSGGRMLPPHEMSQNGSNPYEFNLRSNYPEGIPPYGEPYWPEDARRQGGPRMEMNPYGPEDIRRGGTRNEFDPYGPENARRQGQGGNRNEMNQYGMWPEAARRQGQGGTRMEMDPYDPENARRQGQGGNRNEMNPYDPENARRQGQGGNRNEMNPYGPEDANRRQNNPNDANQPNNPSPSNPTVNL